MPYFPSFIHYSKTYEDDKYIYRHVLLTQKMYDLNNIKNMRKLLSEKKWRSFGISMSHGWQHYMWFNGEKNIMLFRKLKI